MQTPSLAVRAASFAVAFVVSAALMAGISGLAKPPVQHSLLAQLATPTVLR